MFSKIYFVIALVISSTIMNEWYETYTSRYVLPKVLNVYEVQKIQMIRILENGTVDVDW